MNTDKKAFLLRIEIIDNGCGIPEEIMKKIIDGGFSFRKKEGSGLGVSYAIKCINSWGSDYDIYSKPNEGTTFGINLPVVDPPEWFLNEIKINVPRNFIVLDDDGSIHEIWHKRFEKIIAENPDISIQDFYSPEELLEYHKNNSIENVLYLIDYELLGSNLTGLDVIEKLNIEKCSTLVTSRYEDEDIRERCAELGVKILPKGYTTYVPIKIVEKKLIDLSAQIVFLDDSESLTDVWKFQADMAGKTIITFNKTDEFMNTIDSYSKNTIFYIDSELDGGYRGEEVTKILYEKGYENIYIATGFEKSDFSNLFYLKGVVGKSPPF